MQSPRMVWLHEAGLLTCVLQAWAPSQTNFVQWLPAAAGLALLSRLQLRGSGGIAPRFPTLHGWLKTFTPAANSTHADAGSSVSLVPRKYATLRNTIETGMRTSAATGSFAHAPSVLPSRPKDKLRSDPGRSPDSRVYELRHAFPDGCVQWLPAAAGPA